MELFVEVLTPERKDSTCYSINLVDASRILQSITDLNGNQSIVCGHFSNLLLCLFFIHNNVHHQRRNHSVAALDELSVSPLSILSPRVLLIKTLWLVETAYLTTLRGRDGNLIPQGAICFVKIMVAFGDIF